MIREYKAHFIAGICTIGTFGIGFLVRRHVRNKPDEDKNKFDNAVEKSVDFCEKNDFSLTCASAITVSISHLSFNKILSAPLFTINDILLIGLDSTFALYTQFFEKTFFEFDEKDYTILLDNIVSFGLFYYRYFMLAQAVTKLYDNRHSLTNSI